MKYFICALDKTNSTPASYLGIPTEFAERIIPITRVQTAVYETEDEEAFISLPLLLEQKEAAAPHGIVLKNSQNASTCPNLKTVLLSPRIDIDMEIPEERIHGLPEILTEKLRYFSGACFNEQSLILILNPEKLIGLHND